MNIYNIKGTKKLSVIQFIGIVILAIVFLPITLLLIKPLRILKNYCRAKNYTATKLPEDYESKVDLIAHRGFRAVAPENTLPAFEAAGKAGYWGAENDIHRTKDGVWIVHHDFYSYRMTNKCRPVEKSDYSSLLKLNIDNGSNYKDYPNLKIPTVEDYLKICAKYNMKAVIELKGKNNTEHYGEIIDMVKKYGVDAMFISFQKEAITALRKVTDARLFFIVNEITEEAIDFAKSIENCGIDFDGNDDKNKVKEKVDMILNAGLMPAIWAVDDPELIESYANWGVRYITTNAVHY